jgi:uncharacterized membrane protein
VRPALLGLAAGAVVGGAAAALSRGETLVDWPDKVRAGFPLVVGGLVGAAAGIKVGVGSSLLRAVTGHGRGPVTTVPPVLVAAGLVAGAAVAANVASGRFVGKLADQSRELDEGFATPPSQAEVSGGPGSLVTLAELGREGARFVGTVSTPEGIREVAGRDAVAAPVRVFIGYDSAATPEQRVGLAMAELRRTGAFDRAHLLVQAPAGSGYANPTPVDVLELLTLGDCASVAVGYGLLPSFLSLNKVAVASRTQSLLLDAILLELSARESRPRLLLYGESLGAKVQEAAIPMGPDDLDHYGVAAALWVGTPGGREADDFHARCAGESFTVDRPEQIPSPMPAPRPRVWFLEHDGDPVVRSRPATFLHRPAWLPADGSRGRNIPESMAWKPGITWAQLLVDTMFATNVKPGDFKSEGHDYRADLGAAVTAAFDLAADESTSARLEAYLRVKEVERARRIGEE